MVGTRKTRRHLMCPLCNAPVEEASRQISPRLFHVQDKYPVIRGHALLLTRVHERSVASAHLNPEDLRLVGEFLRAEYRDTRLILFEHGMPQHSLKHDCIDHAHIHIVPIPKHVELASFFEVKSAKVVADLPRYRASEPTFPTLETDGEYLWLSDLSDAMYVPLPKQLLLPGQFIRRIVGELFGIRHWDWRQLRALASYVNDPDPS